MKKATHYSEIHRVSRGESETTGSTTGESSGWSESSSHGISCATRSVTHDRCTRALRILLQWNLEDLGDSLAQEIEDLTRDDLHWYLARARRIFKKALQNKQRGFDGENS